MTATKQDLLTRLDFVTKQETVLAEQFDVLTQHIIRLNREAKVLRSEIKEYERLEREALDDLRELKLEQLDTSTGEWIALDQIELNDTL